MKKEIEKLERKANVVDDVEDMTKEVFEEIAKSLQYKKRGLTFGQRAADFLTKWAGSWTFIIFFFLFLLLWISTNIYAWIKSWDPYPFILLNLVLSCLAAIQAPVILMSQNRAAQRDRIKAEFDYRVNKKAEEEIRDIQKQLNRIERRIH